MNELEQMRKYRIVMANTIINDMSYELTAQQLNVLRYMISQIQPTDKPNKLYTLSVKEYCEVCGISADGGKNYRDIKATFEAIDNQVRWISMPYSKKNARIRWFNRLIIGEGSGEIEYSWHEDIVEYLFNLVSGKKPYTQFQREEYIVLGSRYAKRLYEIMRQYFNLRRKYIVIPIGLLKEQLDAEKYERYPDFRRYVLDVAVREINEYTGDFSIEYEGQKVKSRAVTHIAFTITDTVECEILFHVAQGTRRRKLNKTPYAFKAYVDEVKRQKREDEELPF